MFLFVVLKCGLLMKPYRQSYFEILFENFIKRFNMSDDNRI